MTLAARLLTAAALAVFLPLSSGAQEPKQEVGVGPDPVLPEPSRQLLPTLKVARATGWSGEDQPEAAQGLQVAAFAKGLEHPRWLFVLPNGDVLVAETNAPVREQADVGGVRGAVMRRAMEEAGAAVPSPDRITLLRDADGDGEAETREVFLDGLHSPFGMALVADTFYVANADRIVSFPYEEGQTRIDAGPTPVTDLPAGRNHHWTKNIIASPDGSKLYATVGSNSNIGENGMDEEEGRAAIWEVDLATGEKRLFATGLRNPNGLAWNPDTGELWTAVNERDELGDDLVPDYITSVKDGAFYGWPWSYFGQHVDERVKPERPDLVATAIPPDYAVGAHTAALGLAFAEGARLGPRYADGAFVGLHGSWNRDPRSGYKVIFVPFKDGTPDGMPIDVLTGFLFEDDARGRPVGVAIDQNGGLLVVDDVGDTVWRVSARDRAAEAD
jgi:glucose/arabinose dehydrogenase